MKKTKAQKKITKVMREFKKGKLPIGGSKKKVTLVHTITTPPIAVPQDLHANIMIATKDGIHIDYTGTVPEIDTIIVRGGYSTATIKRYKLSEAFRTITIDPTGINATEPILELAHIS